MIISPTRKFIFFKPLKTAGSSVEFALALSCGSADLVTGGTEEEHMQGFVQQNNLYYDEENKELMKRFHTHTPPNALEQRLKPDLFKKYAEYSWITMTRNPWDTLVSYYWWNHDLCSTLEQNEHMKIKLTDSRKIVQEKFLDFIFYTFADFAENGTSPTAPNEPEQSTAYEYILKYNTMFADPRIDHYIRFENIEQDFENVVDELGLLNIELPRFKTSQKKMKKHYSYYYTDESKEIVANGFKDYNEKFNYKFEYKNFRPSRRERAKRRKINKTR